MYLYSFAYACDSDKILFQRFSRLKLKLATLQRPKQEASMALPNAFLYYLAGQLKFLSTWVFPVVPLNLEAHLAHIHWIKQFLIVLEAPTFIPIQNMTHVS